MTSRPMALPIFTALQHNTIRGPLKPRLHIALYDQSYAPEVLHNGHQPAAGAFDATFDRLLP